MSKRRYIVATHMNGVPGPWLVASTEEEMERWATIELTDAQVVLLREAVDERNRINDDIAAMMKGKVYPSFPTDPDFYAIPSLWEDESDTTQV